MLIIRNPTVWMIEKSSMLPSFNTLLVLDYLLLSYCILFITFV